MTDFDSIWRFRDCIVRVLEQFSEKYAFLILFMFCRQVEEHSGKKSKPHVFRVLLVYVLTVARAVAWQPIRIIKNDLSKRESKQAGQGSCEKTPNLWENVESWTISVNK